LSHDDHLLERRIKLLISRERELLTLRRKHARLRAWMSVTQDLKALAARVPERNDLLRHVSEALKAKLGIQRVAFFVVAEALLRRIGGDGEVDGIAAALAQPVWASLAGARDGVGCDRDEHFAVREKLGLERFLWHWIDTSSPRMLLVAGYDGERAPFYPPFDDSDLAQFAMAGQQLNILLERVGAPETSRGTKTSQWLSKRELEVSRLLALGKANKEIAAELGISPRTVQTHIEHIFDKVGERSRAAATRWLVERSVVR
jgi:DNA-binding CsgD family transcriptional regulator